MQKLFKYINDIRITFILFVIIIFTSFWICNSSETLRFEMGKFKYFQADSELLVKLSLTSSRESPEGYFRFGGLMATNKNTLEEIIPYKSQVGLQGMFLNFFAPQKAESSNYKKWQHFFQLSKNFTGLIFAIVLASFLIKSQLEFGFLPAILGAMLISISPWIIAFSENLYWLIFLHFLPFIFTWVFL
jgi:hypothetical protein